jgi:hypothetical protein
LLKNYYLQAALPFACLCLVIASTLRARVESTRWQVLRHAQDTATKHFNFGRPAAADAPL